MSCLLKLLWLLSAIFILISQHFLPLSHLSSLQAQMSTQFAPHLVQYLVMKIQLIQSAFF